MSTFDSIPTWTVDEAFAAFDRWVAEHQEEVGELHPCFICGRVAASLDKEPPWRCHECFNAVAANEADGEP